MIKNYINTCFIMQLIVSACADIGLLYDKWTKYSGLILCKLVLGTLPTSPCHDWFNIPKSNIPKSNNNSNKLTTTSHIRNVLHVLTWCTEKWIAYDKKHISLIVTNCLKTCIYSFIPLIRLQSQHRHLL